MRYPNLDEEKKLWKKGYKRVAGLDEAGRGCLAGPVVAGAVVITCNVRRTKHCMLSVRSDFRNINDSKKLSAKKRQDFYKILTKHPAVEWGVGRVSERVIDRINILEATKLATEKAIINLEKRMIEVEPQSNKVRLSKIDFLILDGNFKIYGERSRTIPQKSIIKADERVFLCAAASIIAKVTRDRIMRRLHEKYPQYNFGRHKGYPTKLHRQMLKKYGPCKIHRKTFWPVKACFQN